MGIRKVIQGLVAPAGISLPQIKTDETDMIVAGVVDANLNQLLRYDFNPAVFSPRSGYSLYGKDRQRGKVASATVPAVTKIDSDPLFNNNPVFSFANASGTDAPNLKAPAPMGTAFTWFAVASIDPSLKASPRLARLMYAVDISPASARCVLGMLAGGSLAMGPSSNPTDTAIIIAGNTPAANTAFVVCGVYDAVAQRTRIYLNNLASSGASTAATIITPEESDLFGIGGNAGYGGTSGWWGKIARELVYDTVLGDDQITTVFNALRAKYGVLA